MPRKPSSVLTPVKTPFTDFINDFVKTETEEYNQRVSDSFYSTNSSVERQLHELWDEVIERHYKTKKDALRG